MTGHNVVYEHTGKGQMKAWHLAEWYPSDTRLTPDHHPPVCAEGRSITYQSCRYLRDLGHTGRVNFIRQSDGIVTHFIKDLVKGADLDVEEGPNGPRTVKRKNRGSKPVQPDNLSPSHHPTSQP